MTDEHRKALLSSSADYATARLAFANAIVDRAARRRRRNGDRRTSRGSACRGSAPCSEHRLRVDIRHGQA